MEVVTNVMNSGVRTNFEKGRGAMLPKVLMNGVVFSARLCITGGCGTGSSSRWKNFVVRICKNYAFW